MYVKPTPCQFPEEITVTEEVKEYIQHRGCDFRICTSCGGPLLLPVSMKPSKPTDLQVKAGDQVIFISIHQARFLNSITMNMLPLFLDQMDDSTGIS
jgi:hypothetical protein